MADMAISRQQTGHRYFNINSSGRTHLGDVHNLNVTHVHHPMADLADVPPSPLSTLPFPKDSDYVRRSLLIEQIHTKLSVPGARVALMGLGGVGKSQLAIDYAYEVRDDSPSTWVLWIHAASATRLEQSVSKTLDDLKVPGRRDPAANPFQLLRNWLLDGRNGKWLLILDNVDDARYLLQPAPKPGQDMDSAQSSSHEERILDYIPPSNHGSILLTSRTTEAATKIVDRKSIITVEPMDVEQAVQLLRKKLDCEHTNEEALELTKALNFMPLAINQAAAYISQEWPRCSVQQYQEKLLKSDKSKFSLLNLDEGDLRRDREAANSILSTWQISFEHIRAVRSSASDLLSLVSFFDRQAIPESLLRLAPAPLEERSRSLHRILGKRKREHETPIQINGDESETAAEDFNLDIKMLRSYSFISAATADTFTMHSLVQFATRKWLQARSEEEIWIARFVYCLYEVWPRKGRYEDWSTCAALYPHIKAAQSLKPTERSASETWACLLYTSAGYAWNRGLPVDARTMSALSSNELVRLEGRESKLALRSMMDLARYTLETQSPATVGHLEAQLVETSKKIYGDDAVMTAKCKCLLAASYSYQGRWKDAETLYAKAVQTMRRALGDEHPTTLISMSNLVEAYWSQELSEEAAVLGEYIFEVRKRVLGPTHLDTLINKANLALIYSDSGLYKKAAMLGSQTLEIQKRLFGPEHPETLVTMSNLALTLSRQEFWDKAIPLSTQALNMLKKVYGHEHARTLAHMRNLAYMYQQQMSHKKAIELWSEIFETSKRALGPEHRDTLSTMADLAQSLQGDGQQQSASDLMELCATRSLDGLGPTHPETVERRQLAEDWRKELMGLGEDDQHDSDGGAYCSSDEEC